MFCLFLLLAIFEINVIVLVVLCVESQYTCVGFKVNVAARLMQVQSCTDLNLIGQIISSQVDAFNLFVISLRALEFRLLKVECFAMKKLSARLATTFNSIDWCPFLSKESRCQLRYFDHLERLVSRAARASR
jgi:hypothetical protein